MNISTVEYNRLLRCERDGKEAIAQAAMALTSLRNGEMQAAVYNLEFVQNSLAQTFQAKPYPAPTDREAICEMMGVDPDNPQDVARKATAFISQVREVAMRMV